MSTVRFPFSTVLTVSLASEELSEKYSMKYIIQELRKSVCITHWKIVQCTTYMINSWPIYLFAQNDKISVK